jgi:hypothetical protein
VLITGVTNLVAKALEMLRSPYIIDSAVVYEIRKGQGRTTVGAVAGTTAIPALLVLRSISIRVSSCTGSQGSTYLGKREKAI